MSILSGKKWSTIQECLDNILGMSLLFTDND